MLLLVLDGNGSPQTVIAQSQGATTSASGTITATGTSQQAAAINLNRGFTFFQNRGANPMYLNDQGAAADSGNSFYIPPGGSWPPQNYPVPVTAINVLGTVGDAFLYREA